MAHIDHDSANTSKQLQAEKTPVPIVYRIDLNDEGFSAALRREFSTIEELAADIQAELAAFWRSHELVGLSEQILNDNTPQHTLNYVKTSFGASASGRELGTLVESLSSSNLTPEKYDCLISLLERFGYGRLLDNKENAAFFKSLETSSMSFARLLALVPSSSAAEALMDSWVSKELYALAATLTDPAQKAKFMQPDIKLRDQFDVLEHVDSARRQAFIEKLILLGEKDAKVREIIADKLDNALKHSPLSEFKLIVQNFLAQKDLKDRDYLIAAILRDSNSLEELAAIVSGIGESKLIKIGPQTQELVAQALLSDRLSRINWLAGAANENNLDKLSRLQRDLKELKKFCTKSVDLRGTKVLLEALDIIKARSADLDGLAKSKDQSGISEQLKCLERLISLELRYGVHITTGESEILDRSQDCFVIPWGAGSWRPAQGRKLEWSLKDLEDIEAVLQSIPETHLLFSDMLRDIELVETLGEGVLGARYHADGKIKIALMTIDNAYMQNHYDGISSLRIVLAHEIGHGLQIGNGSAGYHGLDGDSPHFGGGEDRYDFDEYMEISGWQVIARSRYELGSAYGTIILDGKEVRLNEAVEINGRKMILSYLSGYDILTAYNAGAEFTSRWYSKTSPYEDFAEAIAEYLFLPKRLIQDAPNKFKHLEQEFGKYKDDAEIKRMLEIALQQAN